MTTLLIMISRKKKTYIFKSGWWSSHWFVACWRLTTYSVWMSWCWGTGWGHWWVQRCRWRWLLWICNQVYIKLKRNMFLCKTHYRGVVVITTAQLHSTKPELRFWFKPCSRRAGDSRWWGSLAMVPAGNKAKRLSSVSHTTKTMHHLHHWCIFVFFILRKILSSELFLHDLMNE